MPIHLFDGEKKIKKPLYCAGRCRLYKGKDPLPSGTRATARASSPPRHHFLSLLVVAMALLLAVLGAVLGLVVASSLLLRWNEVRYSRRRGLPPGTMGWPLFGETTEFLKQGPSFMKGRRLRLVGKPARHGISHLHAFSFPVSQRKSRACACSVFGAEHNSLLCLCSFFANERKKKKHTLAGWLMIHEMSSIIEKEGG
jgi:hypothetical protein